MKNCIFYFAILLSLIACRQQQSEPESTLPTVALCGPTGTGLDYKSESKAPLFENMGSLNYKVSTNNEEAQRYFNQGLTLAFGFNHAEAARSFTEVSRLDPSCAMGYWGLAYVLGPNYNAGMDPSVAEDAYKAVQKAKKFSKKATPKEQILIKAIEARYAPGAVEDRSVYDQAYSLAMKEAYAKFPEDNYIATIYAESIMDLHPWDLWKKDGNPQPWTPEIVGILEMVLAKDPDHVGANHFYIHAVEASKYPEKGLISAQRLENLVPGSGHLVHMPSHIYIRTGRYHEGTLVNEEAIQVDEKYVSACYAAGAYPLAYYPHNIHFLAATSALEGNSSLAIKSANKISGAVDKEMMRQPEWGTLQHYYSIPYYVLVKFQKWDEILNLPAPDDDLKYPLAIWHYARGMAFIGKADYENVIIELEKVKGASKDESLKDITIWDINSSFSLVNIAAKVLEGELLNAKGMADKAIPLLREAVELEGGLNYDEPPDWFFSCRHHLGPVLFKSGRIEEAEKVFLEDLEIFPENGYALNGLYKCQVKLNKKQAAEETLKRFVKAWSHADFKLG